MTSPEESRVRYEKASKDSAKLPPDMLTNAQRLKLYALFKQAAAPAPAEPPSRFNAVARAKWEAWNDVRSLTKQQAMDAYSQIIEGLLKLLKAPSPPTTTQPPRQPFTTPPPRPAPQDARASIPPPTAVDAAAAFHAAPEPPVEVQKWSATALSVSAGIKLEVPIVVHEASRCSYTFESSAGEVVGFSLSAKGESPLATARAPKHAGAVDVRLAPDQELVATIDNSGSMFSSLTLAVEVRLEPLRQLEVRDKHRACEQLRIELDATRAAAATEADKVAQLQAEADKVELEIKRLGGLLKQAQKELADTHASSAQSKGSQQTLLDAANALDKRLAEANLALQASKRAAAEASDD